MDINWFSNLAPLMVGAVTFGILFTILPGVRQAAQWFTTLVHEVGHAVIALPFGGKPEAITLRLNGSGQADVAYAGGLLFKPVRVASLLAGYGAPLYLGLLLPLLVMTGQGMWAGVILAGLGVFSLLVIRNLAGFLIILLYGVLAATAVMLSAHPVGVFVIITYSTVLLLRGVMDYVGAGRMVFAVDVDLVTDFHLLQQEVWFSHRYVWYVFSILLHGFCLGSLIWTLWVPTAGMMLSALSG